MTSEQMEAVCVRVANGETIKAIGQDPAMPNQSTLMKAIARDPEFKAMYEIARLARADARADEIDRLINQMLEGLLDAQAAKVAIDAQKWLMSKENAKRYGERIDVNSEIKVERFSDQELDAKIAQHMAAMARASALALHVDRES